MKRFILYTFIVFTLPSCGGSEGRFRLKGEFKNLRQGEFYIYSNDGGTSDLDTIRLEGGEFDYETHLSGHAVYRLLYPNLSEQVIFGQSGDVIKIKGDAQKLSSVEVTGSEANELMTNFRLENKGKGLAETRTAVASFIAEHPESPVGVHLFREYFLVSDGASNSETRKLYRKLCAAQPDNLQLLSWHSDVDNKANKLAKGSRLPSFTLTMEDGEVVRDSDYTGTPLLVNFWASWESRSSAEMFRVKRLLQKNRGKIQALSISLDVNYGARRGIEKMDTVSWHSYCDFLAWSSPLVTQFGVRTLPYYILADADGKVIVSTSLYEKELAPELDKLLETK